MCRLLLALSVSALAAFAIAAQTVKAIRQVDFENFTYDWQDPPEDVPATWQWLTTTPNQQFRATKGIHHFYQPGQDEQERWHSPLVSVDSVAYGDLDGDGAEEAIVALNYSTGGDGELGLFVRVQGGRGEGAPPCTNANWFAGRRGPRSGV